jgi:hypothetical protein
MLRYDNLNTEMFRFFNALPLVILVVSLGCESGSNRYGLPISLGSTSDEVRRVLGGPNERMKVVERDDTKVVTNPDKYDKLVEWYYSSGIVGKFDRDRLTEIILHPVTDYQGFVPYTGTVINGVKVTDSKQNILSKLGKPAKIEADELEAGTDPNVPVVWPKSNRYYWRMKGYLVEAEFLSQAQQYSGPVTLPKDSLTVIVITK